MSTTGITLVKDVSSINTALAMIDHILAMAKAIRADTIRRMRGAEMPDIIDVVVGVQPGRTVHRLFRPTLQMPPVPITNLHLVQPLLLGSCHNEPNLAIGISVRALVEQDGIDQSRQSMQPWRLIQLTRTAYHRPARLEQIYAQLIDACKHRGLVVPRLG